MGLRIKLNALSRMPAACIRRLGIRNTKIVFNQVCLHQSDHSAFSNRIPEVLSCGHQSISEMLQGMDISNHQHTHCPCCQNISSLYLFLLAVFFFPLRPPIRPLICLTTFFHMTLLLKALHMLAFSNCSKLKKKNMMLLTFINDVCDFDICLCDFNPVGSIRHY